MTPARAVSRWVFHPAPAARVAVLRTLVYGFVACDVLFVTRMVVPQSYASPELYHPVHLLDVIGHPAPEPWFTKTLRGVIVVGALLAATGRFQRSVGWLVAVAYLDWCCLAMSYGKVDHDHLAILVAVFVLPTVGQVSWRDLDRTDAAGFALRCIEISVVATYFLSAYAKMRFGDWHWPMGATFTWAVLRRGTSIAEPLLDQPWVLLAGQWALLVMETLTPALLFLRQRWRSVAVAVLMLFHLTTYLTLRIHFLPLVVCLLAFLPLERLPTQIWARSSTTRTISATA